MIYDREINIFAIIKRKRHSILHATAQIIFTDVDYFDMNLIDFQKWFYLCFTILNDSEFKASNRIIIMKLQYTYIYIYIFFFKLWRLDPRILVRHADND